MEAHFDVNTLPAGQGGYCERMARITNILCGILLLVALIGTAPSDHASHGGDADQAHTASLIQDALCGDGPGHGSCQIVAAVSASFPNVAPTAGSSRYVITAVSASNRGFAPRRPPPRSLI